MSDGGFLSEFGLVYKIYKLSCTQLSSGLVICPHLLPLFRVECHRVLFLAVLFYSTHVNYRVNYN